MKALHILYSGLGGSSSVVFSLLNENKKEFMIRQNVLFTGSYLFKGYGNKIKNLDSNYFFIKTKKFFSWFYWFKVFLFLCKDKPDLIFLHNFQFIPSLFYKIIFKKKIIYIDHQSEFFLKSRSLITTIFSLLFFDSIIFVNKKKSLRFKKKFNFFKKKIIHIPNSVDTELFKNLKYNNKKKVFIIGMAARLDFSKRHELIIEALSHNRLKFLDISFSIAGQGERIKELKQLVKRLNLNTKVIFTGSLNEKNIKSWYQNLSLYVHATNGEGMSISILEAMSMQIPVIGSNVIGVKNLLGVKPNIGLLFENSIEDLVNKIEFFFKLSQKNKRLFANHQREFIKENYSSSIMFNKYKKVVLKTLLITN
jgi:glycosyltransferase involved in cell wall biosynthesis